LAPIEGLTFAKFCHIPFHGFPANIRSMTFLKGLLLAATMCCEAAFSADTPAQDGPNAVFHDPLLDNLTGHWVLTGTIMGKPAVHNIDAEWILNHQFLQIHEVGATNAATGRPDYEALPVIGYDHTSERYVAHWIDVFGGRFSETLGYGHRDGNEIHFVFEYPDGPFHTEFTWDTALKQWRWHMSQKDASGKWTTFADVTLTRH
jgi:hypothetical protein